MGFGEHNEGAKRLKELKGFRSIKTKILISFGALVVALVLVLVGIASYDMYVALREGAYERLEVSAEDIAKLAEEKMEREVRYLEGLAGTSVLVDESVPMEERIAIGEAEVARAEYLKIGISDDKGNVTSFKEGAPITNVADREYYQKAMAGESSASNILIDKEAKRTILVFAIPIKEGGSVKGVLIGARSGEFLSEAVKDYQYGQTGAAFMIDLQGTTVAHKDAERVLNQENIINLSKENKKLLTLGNFLQNEVLQKERGSSSYEFDGIKKMAGFSKVHGTPWSIVTIVEEKEMSDDVMHSVTMILLISLGLLILGIVAVYFIGKSISQPIVDIAAVADKQANLDFSFNENIKAVKHLKRKDEVGQMINAIKNMEEKVRELLVKTIESSEQISASSEELTATAQQSATVSEEVSRAIEEIAKGATEQAQDAEKGAVAMNAMDGSLNGTKELLDLLNKNTETVNQLKNEGLHTMGDLVKATDASKKSSEVVHQVIVSTDESVKKISEVTDMIKQIANQTNLLALNAAIEAARAGEAGKGFAVVADEIRKLAEDSNKFTEDIMKIVSELTEKAGSAVQTMENAGQYIQMQTQSVAQTKDQFDGIAKAIDETKRIIDHINQASDEMDQQKLNMIGIIENLSAVSEENAAGTEEAAASVERQSESVQEIAKSSQHLAEIAEELTNLTAKFKV